MNCFTYAFKNLSSLANLHILLLLILSDTSIYAMKSFKSNFKKLELQSPEEELQHYADIMVSSFTFQNDVKDGFPSKKLKSSKKKALKQACKTIKKLYQEEYRLDESDKQKVDAAINTRFGKCLAIQLVRWTEKNKTMEEILIEIFKNRLPDEFLEDYTTNDRARYEKNMEIPKQMVNDHLKAVRADLKEKEKIITAFGGNEMAAKQVNDYQAILEDPNFLLNLNTNLCF